MNKTDPLGRVKSIYVATNAGEPMIRVESATSLSDFGLQGDRYARKAGYWQRVAKPRDTVRDVSLIDSAAIVSSGFTEAETRRNIVVSGMTGIFKLTNLIGRRFRIGNALFLGVEECTPCKRPSDLCGKPDFASTFRSSGGIRAKALQSAEIAQGDAIFLAPLDQD